MTVPLEVMKLGMRDLVLALIGGFVVLAGDLLQASSQDVSSQLQALTEDNRQLRLEIARYGEITRLQGERINELSSIVVKKDILLAKKYESVEAFKQSLDRMPFPVFIKKKFVEEGKIVLRNAFVNIEYTKRFVTTPEFYKGKTDFEVWGQEIASVFYKHDILVLRYSNGNCNDEVYPKDPHSPVSKTNPLYKGWVCKWYDEFEGVPAVIGAIADEQLHIEHLKEATK